MTKENIAELISHIEEKTLKEISYIRFSEDVDKVIEICFYPVDYSLNEPRNVGFYYATTRQETNNRI